MGRWLSVKDRERRDKRVISLYISGVSILSISNRVGLQVGVVCRLLKKHREETGYTPKRITTFSIGE